MAFRGRIPLPGGQSLSVIVNTASVVTGYIVEPVNVFQIHNRYLDFVVRILGVSGSEGYSNRFVLQSEERPLCAGVNTSPLWPASVSLC